MEERTPFDVYLTLGIIVRGNATELQELVQKIKDDTNFKLIFVTTASKNTRLRITEDGEL